jgi:uncharacterized protein (DUF934 family)
VPLLDREGLQADPFDRADPSAEGVIVPFDGLEEALESGSNRPVGVDLPNHVHPSRLAPHLDRLALVAIDFPKFSDGRGFSLARMLREQGYRGRLRATGRILPDQFAFALHSGFDEVEISDEQAARLPAGQWQLAPHQFSDNYVDTRDGRVSVFKRRRAAREAA